MTSSSSPAIARAASLGHVLDVEQNDGGVLEDFCNETHDVPLASMKVEDS